ncbi:MmcQ/YjbR family DNA-binding protein [Caulobacter sp. S45]|uniref:MmcQ/YjbR family DNA-binding protein n=1 Tax=Caulobacter sp. S45 TaxID=1641861 RepID=UPI0015776791|nr:MmcQ/YjbR family DNA-binding protein [Caulobacter sp. S45]
MGSSPDDLRAAALALPEAEEKDHFGAPSFRVNGKIFAQIAVRDGGKALLRLPQGRRELLWEVRPEVFTPSVWGKIISCYVALEGIEPDELAELVRASWAEIAPKKLVAAHPSLPPGG